MAKDYSKYSVQELISHINELENQLKSNKYGLYWDKSIKGEDAIINCVNNIPVLSRDEKTIITNKKLNHILIEGDNYHSLVGLNMFYKESIDVIYIDPPYNTGNEDFSYNDKMVDEEDGFRHSKWLSFMKQRLVLAKELLKEDGIIFISIDDNEQANLKLLCDSIFGAHNMITQFIWEKTQHFGRQKINSYSNCEYVLCYAKKLYDSNKGRLKELLVERINTNLTDAPLYNASNKLNELEFPIGSVKFNLKDGIYDESDNSSYVLLEPVTVKNHLNSTVLKLKFKSRWSQNTINEELAKGTTFWVKSKGFAIRAIYHEGKSAKVSPKQIIFTNANNPLCAYTRFDEKVGVNEEGTKVLRSMVKQNIFTYPKPVSLIKYLINLYYDYKNEVHPKDITVLDFFAGSGTTGQAVLELNKEDGGNRRFILCTNNENNICECVTYERIKTIITGLKKDGSSYGDPIEDNLIYFKNDFIKNHSNKDQSLYSLVEKVDQFLCIKEDIFKYVNSNSFYSHYISNGENEHLFIYFDFYNPEKFSKFKEEISKAEGLKKVYIYSNDNNVDDTLLNDVDNVILKPIPAKIYEIYKEIVENIKREESL